MKQYQHEEAIPVVDEATPGYNVLVDVQKKNLTRIYSDLCACHAGLGHVVEAIEACRASLRHDGTAQN